MKKFDPLLDDRTDVSAGWKFNEWELKGVPIRIEIGPKDIENKSVVVKVRVDDEKKIVKIKDLKIEVPKLLTAMQEKLLKDSSKLLYDNLTETEDKKELDSLIKARKVVAVPFCDSEACEEQTKADLGGAKALWVDEKHSAKGKKCIACGADAKYWLFFGKTY